MKSELQKINEKYGVEDVYDLSELSLEKDQEQIMNETFDVSIGSKNLNNQIKDDLEKLDIGKIKHPEQEVVKDILWLWYHHASTVYIWEFNDLQKGKESCKKALSYLYEGHPNKMTKLILLLLEEKLEEAKEWVKNEVTEHEMEYADQLMEDYKKGIFKAPNKSGL